MRAIDHNPFVSYLIGIESHKDIPSRMAVSRFLAKLVDNIDHVRLCSARLSLALMETLPRFGEVVAVDGSALCAFSNGSKDTPSDQDATWSAKGGRNGEKNWWFGHKAHLLCDATHEIPIWLTTTTAKVNDLSAFFSLVKQASHHIPGFSPKYVLADAGYDGKRVYRLVADELGAVPIIAMRLFGIQPNEVWDERCTYDGTPSCDDGYPMRFVGFERSRGTSKWRCSRKADGKHCLCSDSAYGQVVRIKVASDYRRHCAVPRSTPRWKRLYDKRSSVERVFGRLKEFRRLDKITLRGKQKIELHCLMAVITMQAMALGKARQEALSEVRNNVHRVA